MAKAHSILQSKCNFPPMKLDALHAEVDRLEAQLVAIKKSQQARREKKPRPSGLRNE